MDGMPVPSLKWLLAVGLLTGMLTCAVAPFMRRLAARNGLVDRPNYRKKHAVPTPACGGLAIFFGLMPVFVGLLASSLLHRTHLSSDQFLRILSLFGACGWILFLGILDDRKGLTWSTKLAGQALGIGILALGGHFIKAVTLPIVGVVTFGWFGIIIFGVLLIAITNAINLIDGLDGLCDGHLSFCGTCRRSARR